jgi:uncharacterized protein (UPF0218 family)
MTLSKDTWDKVKCDRAALKAEDAAQMVKAPGSVPKNAAALSGMRGPAQAFIGDVITRHASTRLTEADAEAQRVLDKRAARERERGDRLKRFEDESDHANPGTNI